MNKFPLITILIVIVFFSCSTSESISQFSEEMLPSDKEKLIVELHHSIAVEYLDFLEEENLALAIGNFGWTEVRECWAKVPEISKYRTAFDVANQNFVDFVNAKDEGLKVVLERAKEEGVSSEEWSNAKSAVYGRVRGEYPEEYSSFLNERQEKLRICNYKTLGLLIDDYHKKGALFPIKWIPSSQMKRVLNEEFVQELEAQMEGTNLEITELYQE